MSATEGSGKIPLYMAMGLPTITFDTPVSHEYLGDAGIYAAFGSAADLAAKIRQALEHRSWATDVGARGRERAVRELSWDRAARQIEAIYAGALGRPTADDRRPSTTDQRPVIHASPHRSGEEREEAVERGA
jgi:glycosyltransferase involved in cell wall biosynthesis